MNDFNDLTHRWETLLEEQRNDAFDYAYFCKLAADTFQLLFPLHDEVEADKRDIPRGLFPSLLLAKTFAGDSAYISEECEAAKFVAEAFCSQLAYGWTAVDGGFPQERFAVKTPYGLFHIDTATFNLSPILKECQDLFRATEYTHGNKDILQKDKRCGCFSCLKIFSPDEIQAYTENETLICPHCGMPTILGESAGYPVTEEFLQKIDKYWGRSDED